MTTRLRAPIAVALDAPDVETAARWAQAVTPHVAVVKVGLELFCRTGPTVVETVRGGSGVDLFLDLKLHDIPNTVAGAIRSATQAGASLLTIHAGGGPAMMTAAAEAAQTPGSPRLLAVTVLTSMDATQLAAVGVSSSPADQVLRLAKLALQSGINGMVCSPEEAGILRSELGSGPLLVIPGIRPAGSDVGDQKRIATPTIAIERGASMLVVGRPITLATNPAEAAESILREIEQASGTDR